MPDSGGHNLYSLEQLQPLVEAGQLLLTPNYRLARRIKTEWDKQQAASGLSQWRPIRVLALETWLDQCVQQALGSCALAPLLILDPLRVQELWRQVIEDASQQHYSLLQPATAAQLAAQGRDNLLRWCVDTGAEAVQSEFRLDEDCGTFLRWLQAFEQRLHEDGLATRADSYHALLASDYSGEQPAATLLEFDDLPPLYQRCLDQLASSWQRLDAPGADAPGVDAPARVLAFDDRADELAAVARWAAQQYQQRPEASIGIVLADMHGDRPELEYLLRREFDCLGENYTSLPVNFSTGITLDQAPVVRDALRILATLSTGISLADVTGLLQSRFSCHTDRYTDLVVKLLIQLYGNGPRQLDLGQLRYAAQQVRLGDAQGLQLGSALAEVSAMRLQRERNLPSAWVARFNAVLELWGWPGRGPLDSLEYQQVEQWYRMLEQFAAADSVHAPLDASAALALLRRCCQSQVSQPQTPDSALQVLGPLEGAGLRFDALWLCGLQGSRWPAAARPNPFLPIGLQRRLQMPHASAEREWHFAAALMQRYRRGAGELIASYSCQVDGIGELPSPLLAGLPVEAGEPGRGLPAAWLQVRDSFSLESLQDDTALPLSEEQASRLGGGSGIVQDQANCPFRAFASRRLGIETLGDEHEGLSSADRGSLLHDALFCLWGELGDSDTLQALDSAGLLAASSRAAQQAIDGAPGRLRQLVGMHCLELEQRRLSALLQEWLALERRREGFKVVAREEPVELPLGGLKLQLRVDRVDELSAGGHLVIDYKSGRNSLADWLGERPAQPQLPLYGLATDVQGLAFAEVRPREARFQGLAGSDAAPGVHTDIPKAVGRYTRAEEFATLRSHWQRDLTALAEAFVRGEARVDPLPAACTFCGLQTLCRVDMPQGEGA